MANASNGEYIMSAANEKMFASPIFAPGINIGGNWFSIMNIIRLSAVNTARVAIFFAADFPFFISVLLYTIINN